ncbi:MAG TPA: diguanylate cyclase, partial [Planctomycetota bacterium]|nr:diguanylate cyclase [Planctomycetota bacterium]
RPTAERRAISPELFADPEPHGSERRPATEAAPAHREGKYVFGKAPEKLGQSAKIDVSYERTDTPGNLIRPPAGGASIAPAPPTSLSEPPSDRSNLRPGAARDRFAASDRIDLRSSDSRSPRGGGDKERVPGGAELDFDRWKDKKEKKLVDELQEQNTELTSIITILPGLTKRLSETTKKRDVAPLLADMVQRLCMPPPEKVAVFLAAAKNKEELVLAARIGYPEEADGIPVTIPKTWGRIGYAIRHQMIMDSKDFERDHIDDPPAASGQFWRTQVAAPLVSGKEILGAISVEGFGAYNKNAKKLIYVAANLGALAISLAEKTALIQHQANTDALTGLFNKRYFFERLDVEIERARQTGKPLSIFMFDIDHFKKYNDRNGHQAGDEALKVTGQLLNERRRESDIAARYGGEEFIVILPDTPKEGAYIFGESFRKIIESYPYSHGEGQPLGKVSISGGVSTFPEDAAAPNALIEAADACLYRSKEAGRNHVTKYRAQKEESAKDAVA